MTSRRSSSSYRAPSTRSRPTPGRSRPSGQKPRLWQQFLVWMLVGGVVGMMALGTAFGVIYPERVTAAVNALVGVTPTASLVGGTNPTAAPALPSSSPVSAADPTPTIEPLASPPSTSPTPPPPVPDPSPAPADPKDVEPTALPALLPTPSLLWSDDFDGGIGSGWQVVEGQWIVANGRLIPADESGGVILGGDLAWTDYTVDVDLYESSGGQFVGVVMVRVQDRSNYIAFVADCNRGTWWEIVRNGQRQEVPGTDNGLWMCSTPYHLRLTVQGSSYQAFVDGELQSSCVLQDFSTGGIGLQSISRGSLAAFDNFHVSR